ncbi:MAG: 30S ribosome-binding factor RbfA [Gammaproteobacteria bacterium]|nr:30S ribosome-binding factor RbfA [Gammaproteobacteria bacterium]
MTKGFRREQRINELIQVTLANIIQHEALDLQLTTMVTITGVSVTHDLSLAKVFISVLEEDKSAEVISLLNQAAKQLRHQLASEVHLRVTPELRFVYDDSIVRGNRITSLISDALKNKE